jgi:prolyl oligopeptidase
LSFDIKYPTDLAPKGKQFDNYKTESGSSVKVSDPYRFLEQPDSNSTKAWANAEATLTERFFNESKIMKKISNKMSNLN